MLILYADRTKITQFGLPVNAEWSFNLWQKRY